MAMVTEWKDFELDDILKDLERWKKEEEGKEKIK